MRPVDFMKQFFIFATLAAASVPARERIRSGSAPSR